MKITRTKLVDKKVYVRWYNLAKNLIKNKKLIPERTEREIFELVSQENWLIFCQDGDTKEIAIQKEDPNIFLDVLSKEGNLTGFARLGLNFNNIKSYNKFKTIMRGYNKDLKNRITSKLLSLEKDWKMSIARKIKANHNLQTPEYHREDGWYWDTKRIDDKIIDEIIKIGEMIRAQGIINREKIRVETGKPKKYYVETPSINLMDETFPLNEEEFSSRILEIFDVLSLCLNVKTDIEIDRVIRDKTRQLKGKEEELKNKEKHLKDLDVLKKINPKMVDEKKEKEIETEIQKLKEEIRKLRDEIEKSK